MILSDLDYQVLVSALRFSSYAMDREKLMWQAKGDKKSAEACKHYSDHCAELAKRFVAQNPRADKSSQQLILPNSLQKH